MTFANISVKTKNGFCQFDLYATRVRRITNRGAMWDIVDRRGWHPTVTRGLTAQQVREFLAANA